MRPDPANPKRSVLTNEEIAIVEKVFPPIYVIYDHPKDYPDQFVVRCWYGGNPPLPTALIAAVDTIEEARMAIRRAGGCCPFDRNTNDDPSMAEIWI